MQFCRFYIWILAVPGKPTGVTLLEAVRDYMVVGWTEPATDGGGAIRGYFVDYRTVKGNVVGKWHELNHQALTTTSYKVNIVQLRVIIKTLLSYDKYTWIYQEYEYVVTGCFFFWLSSFPYPRLRT